MAQVQLGDIAIGNDCPMVLLGGVNVLEDEAFALRCAALRITARSVDV